MLQRDMSMSESCEHDAAPSHQQLFREGGYQGRKWKDLWAPSDRKRCPPASELLVVLLILAARRRGTRLDLNCHYVG
jgi:hypothetical protein